MTQSELKAKVVFFMLVKSLISTFFLQVFTVLGH